MLFHGRQIFLQKGQTWRVDQLKIEGQSASANFQVSDYGKEEVIYFSGAAPCIDL